MTKIVVASDLSDRSALALRRAILLARSMRAELTVLHVSESGRAGALADAQAALERALERALDHALAVSASDRPAIETRVVAGDACARIVEFAQSADLLVLGEPRRQTLREFFIGATAHRIMQGLATPGLMVRTQAMGPYQRAVLAVDFSQHSIRAIEAARELGLAGGQSAAVHAYDLPQIQLMVEAGSWSLKAIKQQIRHERTKVERQLSSLMKQMGIRARPVALLSRTTPAAALLAFATSSRADLIVLGSRGRSQLAKLALGSVAEDVLVHAPCDILLVPK